MGGSDDEAEEDAVISQVLDEIGIEVSSKVREGVGGYLILFLTLDVNFPC